MTRRIVLALLLLAGAAVAAEAQYEKMPSTRLYPKSANTDGTLNCAPTCGMLGPCC